MIRRPFLFRRTLAGIAALLLALLGGASATPPASAPARCSLYPSVVAAPDGRLLLAWREIEPVSGRPRVRTAAWNGSWRLLEPLFAQDAPRSSSNPSLTLDGAGRPLIAWEQSDGRHQQLHVQLWLGDAWQGVGADTYGPDGPNAFEPALAWRASELVLAWREYDEAGQSNDIRVGRWDGSAWRPLGGVLDVDPAQGSYSPALALDRQGLPVVAWREHGAGRGTNIRVKRWDGSAWRDLGATVSRDPERAAEVPSLAIDHRDRPVVAWQEHDGTSTNIYVARWDEGVWTPLGDALDAQLERAAHRPSLAIDPAGLPVVAWSERHEVETVFVKRWDGTRWRHVGGAAGLAAPAARGDGYAPSLAVGGDGSMTVAWHAFDGVTYRLRIRRWDGAVWRELPAPTPVSAGEARTDRSTAACRAATSGERDRGPRSAGRVARVVSYPSRGG